MEKRACFGSKEYCPGNSMCSNCESYEECGEIAPDNWKRRASRSLTERIKL